MRCGEDKLMGYWFAELPDSEMALVQFTDSAQVYLAVHGVHGPSGSYKAIRHPDYAFNYEGLASFKRLASAFEADGKEKVS